MKCLVAISALLSVASAQYYLQDTPEVAAAKQQFAAAYNAAARAAQAASPYAEAHQAIDDSVAPAAVPYIHEDIPAVPYVHEEIPAEPYIHLEPARQRAGQDPYAAPANYPNNVYNNQPAGYDYQQAYQQAYQQPQQAYAQQPQQYGNEAYGCFNNKGEGVPCRTDFSANLQY